jgi:hypothetical protein
VKHLANRLLRWFIYTFLFALLPTLIISLFGFVFDITIKDNSTELFFFTIMLCATSLNDIQENKKYAKKDFVFNLFFGIFIIMIVIVSVLYGSIIFIEMADVTTELFNIEMTDVTTELFNNKIQSLAIIVSLFSGIISLILQVILHRTEVAI